MGTCSVNFKRQTGKDFIQVSQQKISIKFKISSHVAIHVKELSSGLKAYTRELGLTAKPVNNGELTHGDSHLYLMESSNVSGPVLALIVDDIEKAKHHLVKHGWYVIRWERIGNDCYMKDPNGIVFNLW
ncbi:MAG: VOC family protein [Candidatus Marinimicrobia bacterium]|nr:VOC family protein [Candidatus Neomarinimicrobiota bacterium]